ncbi:DEKNAAC100653 [Brettanomyces naardenensis]|uniref:Lysophospholipase n=1 Tax=Brettanomyces naardenensis TaxID=13370 RepID=A0A448YGJ1_BRENA|nr:DEKNAAC100653 [Brettanomyces naardenensis]
MKGLLRLTLLAGLALASYAPSEAQCPSKNVLVPPGGESEGLLRDNTLLSEKEYEWVQSRRSKATPKLIDFLNGLNLTDFQGDHYFDDYFKSNGSNESQSSINVGLSFSGGSFRALLVGAGQISALDSRTKSSGNSTALQGLLDSSVYLSALSGGSIMISSLIFQNWSSVDQIIDEQKIWNFTEPPVSTDLTFWAELLSETSPRKSEGFNITLVDLFGRILSKYMFADYEGNGIDLLWSDIQNLDAFTSQEMPFPMILATGGVNNNQSDFADNVFEISPYEFGSWSPFVGGFAEIEYLGTSFKGGKPTNSSGQCVTKFDNAGLMVAYSSDLLAGLASDLSEIADGNMTALNELTEGSGASILGNFNVSYAELSTLLSAIGANPAEVVYALVANPFYESTLPVNGSDITTNDTLKLVDGGEFNEGVPMDPFLVPAREVDVVFAYDNSGNTNESFPNGLSLISTKERWLKSFPDDNFYDIPNTTEEFIAKGLNTRPVFFGCNGTTLVTDQIEGEGADEFNYMKPLLVYVPNTNTTALSNTTSVTLTDEERDSVIRGGFEVATRLNFTLDDEFAQCAGCAILRRSMERRSIEFGEQCQRCFQRYCYSSGDEDSNDLDEEHTPTSVYGNISSSTAGSTSSASASASGSGSSGSSGSSKTATSSSSKGGAVENYPTNSFWITVIALIFWEF